MTAVPRQQPRQRHIASHRPNSGRCEAGPIGSHLRRSLHALPAAERHAGNGAAGQQLWLPRLRDRLHAVSSVALLPIKALGESWDWCQ